MSIAEQLKTEGRQEGRQEGRVDLVWRLLKDTVGKLSDGTRTNVEGLSSDLLFQLLKTAHSFETSGQLDEWLASHS